MREVARNDRVFNCEWKLFLNYKPAFGKKFPKMFTDFILMKALGLDQCNWQNNESNDRKILERHRLN